MGFIFAAGIVAGFIALSEGVKHACKSYIADLDKDAGKGER